MPSSPAVSWSTFSQHVRKTTLDVRATCAHVIPSKKKKVRFVPDWFPGAGFKRLARVARARGEHMVDGAFDAAKEAMNGDDSIPSLVGSLLSREGPKEMTRDEYEYTIKWAAGSLYGGAYLRTPFMRLELTTPPSLSFSSWNRVGEFYRRPPSPTCNTTGVFIIIILLLICGIDDVKHHHVLALHGSLPPRPKAHSSRARCCRWS